MQSDSQLGALIPDPGVETALANVDMSHAETVALVLERYASRQALGFRAYDVVPEASTGRSVRRYRSEFEMITYAELHRRVKSLASALRQGHPPGVLPGDYVCMLGFNGVDYTTVDLACAFTQAVSVPLQSAMGRDTLAGILNDTAPVVIAASVTDLVLAAELVAMQSSVRTLIVLDFDERIESDQEALTAARALMSKAEATAQLITLSEAMSEGEGLTWVAPAPSPEGSERTALLLHSSGTTGTPKGAIHTERLVKRPFAPSPVALPIVRLIFQPMNHQAGRSQLYSALAHGGTAYFVATSDLSTLFEDIQLVRPTDGWFFPRVLEMIYEHFRHELSRRSGQADALEGDVRNEILAEMRAEFLGGRLCMMVAGGAPTLPEVKRFIVEDLQIDFREGFGSTESGSLTLNERVDRANVIEYRLLDVPELGYYSSDKPYPRGELCVKTRSMIPGYFKRPDANAGLFDEEGFAHTADIMEERGPDHLVYIDRRNDVLKLAQGEFVAAGLLGTVFENESDVIHQIFVYGSATRSFVLAVVVPDRAVLRSKLGHEPADDEVRRAIRAELKRVAGIAKLRPFEVPRDFVVEVEPFSQENGLLTALRKRIRPAIQRKYAARLEQLYGELEQRQRDELAALRDGSSHLTVLERVGRALEASLAIDDVDLESPASFSELGGDSLGAAAFAGLLEDIFGVEVAVNAILSPAGNPKQWARSIEAALTGASGMPTAAMIHGKGAVQLDAKDLSLEAFLGARFLETAATAPPPLAPSTVLLTGATGFLGRFLCIEWLERSHGRQRRQTDLSCAWIRSRRGRSPPRGWL